MDKLSQFFQRRKRKGHGPPPLPNQASGITTALTSASYAATPAPPAAPAPEAPAPATNGPIEAGSDSEQTEIEEQFPELSPQEEAEIIKNLGLDTKGKSVKEVIVGTLRSFKQVKVMSEQAPQAAPAPSEELEDFGTVRIKTDQGTKLGTLRGRKGARELFLAELKDSDDAPPPPSMVRSPSSNSADDEGEDFGTVRIKPLSTSGSSAGDRDEDAFSTLKVNELSSGDGGGAPDWAKVMERGKDSSQSEKPQFDWRPPEDWELAILALERGEFDPTTMQEDAFRKYKKERPKLSALNSGFFIQDKSTGAVSTSPSSTPPAEKKLKRKKSAGGKDSPGSARDTVKDAAKKAKRGSGNPPVDEDKKKAVFKRAEKPN